MLMREHLESEIQYLRSGNIVPDPSLLAELEADYAWCTSDEIRTVWEVTGGWFGSEVIIFHRRDWLQTWIDNTDDDGCPMKIKETQLTGREFGNQVMFDG